MEMTKFPIVVPAADHTVNIVATITKKLAAHEKTQEEDILHPV